LANRERQRRTVSESTSQRRAISSLATPSLAHNSPRACTNLSIRQRRRGRHPLQIGTLEPLTGIAAAIVTGIVQPTELIHRRTTSSGHPGRAAPTQRHRSGAPTPAEIVLHKLAELKKIIQQQRNTIAADIADVAGREPSF